MEGNFLTKKGSEQLESYSAVNTLDGKQEEAPTTSSTDWAGAQMGINIWERFSLTKVNPEYTSDQIDHQIKFEILKEGKIEATLMQLEGNTNRPTLYTYSSLLWIKRIPG